MTSMLKSKIFWITLIAVAIVFMFSGADKNNQYESRTEILVIAKSEKTANHIELIIENVLRIPKTLSFREKMLKETAGEDPDNAPLGRKERSAWNKKIGIERVKKTSLLRISASGKNPIEANELSRKAALQTAIEASRYYNIKNDLEIRIFDGPAAGQKTIPGPLKIIFGLLIGFAAGALFFLIFFPLRKNFRPLSPFRQKFGIPGPAKLSAAGKPEYSEKEKQKEAREEKSGGQPAMNAAFRTKSSAPDNLPVGENFVLQAIGRFEHKTEEKKQEEIKEIRSHEATPGEVKERLNKLLRGEM